VVAVPRAAEGEAQAFLGLVSALAGARLGGVCFTVPLK